jgi:hypothetical protein
MTMKPPSTRRSTTREVITLLAVRSICPCGISEAAGVSLPAAALGTAMFHADAASVLISTSRRSAQL